MKGDSSGLSAFEEYMEHSLYGTTGITPRRFLRDGELEMFPLVLKWEYCLLRSPRG